jgi:hypothetical protein
MTLSHHCRSALDKPACSRPVLEQGRRLLGDYHGTVVADGYRVYKNLARDGPGYRLAHCWAHVLRKFRDGELNDPRSQWILERIGAFYEAEREIVLHDPAAPKIPQVPGMP